MLFTADDAGASPQVNEAIRGACTAGRVNSVAYLVNLPGFDDAVDRLSGTGAGRSLHLNLVEGRPLALAADSPLLDADGYFAFQSTGLLLAYYRGDASRRERMRQDIRTEAAAQLEAYATGFGSRAPVAIDSHQHVHMFPFVLGEVLSAVADRGLEIARLRWPVERASWRNGLGLRGSAHLPANLVKVLALRGMAAHHGRTLDAHAVRGDTLTGAFCGVMHTGHMTAEVARRFLAGPAASVPPGRVAELLIHPGGGDEVTDAWRRSSALCAFYTSPWRARELALAEDASLPLPA
jgi:chitin disaccharide deacetylase